MSPLAAQLEEADGLTEGPEAGAFREESEALSSFRLSDSNSQDRKASAHWNPPEARILRRMSKSWLAPRSARWRQDHSKFLAYPVSVHSLRPGSKCRRGR